MLGASGGVEARSLLENEIPGSSMGACKGSFKSGDASAMLASRAAPSIPLLILSSVSRASEGIPVVIVIVVVYRRAPIRFPKWTSFGATASLDEKCFCEFPSAVDFGIFFTQALTRKV